MIKEKTMLEVCVDSMESAVNAICGGADELEVCSSLGEGGLTPTGGLVKQIQDLLNNDSLLQSLTPKHEGSHAQFVVKKPKINVMLRCRTGSDFCFKEIEMDTMLADLDLFKEMKIDRFVFGALTSNQEVDEAFCFKVINRAKPIPVTFHRAFDVCKDPFKALEKIIFIGFNRILTSGQKPSALDEKAIAVIKNLMKVSNDRIEIMPGAGVTHDNVQLLTNIGCKIVHSSCKEVRYLPGFANHLTMGTNKSEFLIVADEYHVRKLKDKICP